MWYCRIARTTGSATFIVLSLHSVLLRKRVHRTFHDNMGWPESVCTLSSVLRETERLLGGRDVVQVILASDDDLMSPIFLCVCRIKS